MNAYEHLLLHDIKPSQQRIALMDFLLENRTHPTVEEVYSRLFTSMPTLSKTTIYNTLKLFVQKGAAQMLTIDERKVCFDADTSCHAHFLCTRCASVYDLHALNSYLSTLPREIENFQVNETQLYYRGVCKGCLEKEAEE